MLGLIAVVIYDLPNLTTSDELKHKNNMMLLPISSKLEVRKQSQNKERSTCFTDAIVPDIWVIQFHFQMLAFKKLPLTVRV